MEAGAWEGARGYVASGMTSEARWKFGANRLSFKGGTDKRTLQLYIIDVNIIMTCRALL